MLHELLKLSSAEIETLIGDVIDTAVYFAVLGILVFRIIGKYEERVQKRRPSR